MVKIATDFDLEKERVAIWKFHSEYQHKRVAVIYGPKSREDRYYIDKVPWDQLGISTLLEAFHDLGFSAIHVDPTKSTFREDVESCEFCFLNVHGEYGEDGRLQGFLDYLGRPYTGSGVQASAVGISKILFKQWLLGVGIATPNYWVVSNDGPTYPVIAKPVLGGSSIGARLINSNVELEHFVHGDLPAAYGPYFYEEFIEGRSLTVTVLEMQDSLAITPVLGTTFEAAFYDEITKAGKGLSSYDIPANINVGMALKIQEIALQIHQMLGCSGFSRVDFVLPSDGRDPVVLEINTIPGMSQNSNFAVSIAALGFSYSEMLLIVLRSCLCQK